MLDNVWIEFSIKHINHSMCTHPIVDLFEILNFCIGIINDVYVQWKWKQQWIEKSQSSDKSKMFIEKKKNKNNNNNNN
jgi:hypothetical protein